MRRSPSSVTTAAINTEVVTPVAPHLNRQPEESLLKVNETAKYTSPIKYSAGQLSISFIDKNTAVFLLRGR